jgi:hypothetical protein
MTPKELDARIKALPRFQHPEGGEVVNLTAVLLLVQDVRIAVVVDAIGADLRRGFVSATQVRLEQKENGRP